MAERMPLVRVTAMPTDTNPYGGVLGGWLTSWTALAGVAGGPGTVLNVGKFEAAQLRRSVTVTRTIALSCALNLALAACSQAPDPAQDTATTTPVAQGTDEGRIAIPAPADTDLDKTSATYDGPIPKPIMIGGDGPEMDACGTFARVANLNPAGDNYLSVRDAPSASTKERDRLDPGQGVAVCVTENGWSGIIYAKPGDKTLDCGVGMPADKGQPYRGSCRQGWVDSRFLEQVAG